MSGEPWARVSLRIHSPSLSAGEIEQLMGAASVSKASDLWAADLVDDSSLPLDEQLRAAKDYLRGKAEILASMTDADVGLTIGWTPRVPQDGIALDVELITLLAAIRCHILLDTYLD